MDTEFENNIPRHVAFIMDGNGRWATAQGLSRVKGHEEGAKRLRELLDYAQEIGIEQLTFYSFSMENWKRPAFEVNFLMRLLRSYLKKEREDLVRRNVKFTAIGQLNELPKEARKEVELTIEATRECTGITMCLALSYGSRAEITGACKALAEDVLQGKLSPDDITEDLFSRRLQTKDMPDPDLLIRTAGEMRISNFLLWQISYTELWVTDLCWPDFHCKEFKEAISDYKNRTRKFGTIA